MPKIIVVLRNVRCAIIEVRTGCVRRAIRHSTRAALIVGKVVGAISTALLVLGGHLGNTYPAIGLGLIVSGTSRGIPSTGMCVETASRVHHDEQGVGKEMTFTALSIGNAIGLAVLIAIANRHMAGFKDESYQGTIAEVARHVPRLVALAIEFSSFTTLALLSSSKSSQ